MENSIEIKGVVLKVSNLEQSINFYEKFVGLELVSITDDVVSMGVDNRTLLQLYVPKDVQISKGAYTGLYHTAFLLPSEHDLARLLRYYQDIGISDLGAGDHIFSQAFYLNDPDGNGIEIYADRDKSEWEYDDNGQLLGKTLPVDVQQLLTQTEDKEWKGAPSATKIGHVHLQVRDMDAAKKFLVDFLGMDITISTPSALFVSKDDYHHHVGTNTWSGADLPDLPKNHTGLDYYTLKLKDYNEIISKLDEYNFDYEIKANETIIKDGNGIRVKLISSE